MAHYSFPLLCQMLTDFQNSFTSERLIARLIAPEKGDVQQKICNRDMIKDPTTLQMRRYITV